MRDKVIIIGANYKNESDFNYTLEELKNLAINFNFEVISVIVQNLNSINPVYYIGKGKLDEVKQLINDFQVSKVIFNDELSASQIRNIEEQLDCEVLDRSNLILSIFDKRAASKESKLQVEIARLQYLLPRLVDNSGSLSRQRGGGVVNRGSGETKLEMDRQRIEIHIKTLKKDLEAVVNKRNTQRNLRQKNNMKVVSLVGYTNAGKSTLLNAIMDKYQSSHKSVVEKDMLFATLDTSVRQIKFDNTKTFLAADTVGFIDKLPHHLINAFRSTLEEVLDSDLLLHVVDYSHPNYLAQIKTVDATLKELGVKDIPVITVYNKVDLVNINIPSMTENEIYISAKNKVGITELVEIIVENLYHDECLSCKMFIPYDKMNLVNYFHQNAIINSTSYEATGTKLSLTCTKKDFDKFQKYII